MFNSLNIYLAKKK